ncbi:GNAT family N-acetyltransferase [Sphingobacterium spiritivorum]|uniref:GNAT family N-acetyltransferase n=1 Tax=Sphingobacterium spiritivorum TaxID=258 RepID=UPI003DA4887D
MNFELQPTLENQHILLQPLREEDFQILYAVASDPSIWRQHPNKDRWRKEVFQIFFDGAIGSGGAYVIKDKLTGMTIGSTRFYDYQAEDNSILIGYTFYATSYWGKGINSMVKKMMLNYIFQFVSKVKFHIGSQNIRSQISIARLGAVKIGHQDVAYYGEDSKPNYIYQIEREAWLAANSLTN